MNPYHVLSTRAISHHIFFLALTLAVPPCAQAQVLHWDINSTSPGSSDGATAPGTWDAVNTFWNEIPDGTGVTGAWQTGGTAIFSAGANATGAYPVTVSGTQIVEALTFAVGDVTLVDGTLQSHTSPFTVTVADGAFGTVNSQITGDDGLTKSGAGTLTLTGANTYTGGTTISSGTLQLGGGGATGSVAGNITNNGSLVFNRSDDHTFGGVISGGGGVVNDGFILRFSEAQTYTGPTSVTSGGYLVLASTVDQGLAASATVDLAAGAYLDISNRSLTLSGLTGSGTIYSFGGSSGHLTLDIASEQSQAFSGVLGGAFPQFAFTKTGDGMLTLTGTHTYTGPTTIENGTLKLGPSAGLSVTTVTVNSPAILDIDNHSVSVGALAGSGTVSLGSGTLTAGVNHASTPFGGDITGSGVLVKAGSGILTLSGAKSHTGGTTVAGGLIEFSSLENFGTGDITLNGGGLRWADGVTTDIMPQLGPIGPSGGTFDTNGNTITFGTALTTANPLTKQGTGTLTLSGANTAGSVILNGGTLNLVSGASLTTSSWLSLADGHGSSGSVALTDATLDIGTALYVGYLGTGSLTIGDGGLVDAAQLRLADTGAGVATVTLNPGGTLQVGGAHGIVAGSGDTTLNFVGGTLRLNANDFTTFEPITLTGTNTFDTNGHNGGIYGSLSGTGGFTKVGAGVLTVTHANPFSGAVTVDAGTLVVNTATDLGTGNGAVSVNSGGALAAATHLEFARNVIVTGNDSVVVSPNHLEVGSAGDGDLTVADGAILASGTTTTLAYFAADNGTVDVSGTDSILYAQTALRVGFGGSGTLDLADGGTANAQNLILGSGADSSGTINLLTGGVLQVGGSDGISAGEGSAVFNLAGGTIRVGGDERIVAPPPPNEMDLNNLAAEIRAVIDANVPQPADTGLTTAVPMTLSNTSTIDTNNSSAHLSGLLTGDGALTKTGAGTLTLSGDIQSTGAITVDQGTLELSNGLLAEGAEILIAHTGTLASTGTIARNLRNNANVISLGETPLTFTGDVAGTGQFTGNFLFSGTTRPGQSPGLMEVDGDLTFGSEHVLEMEIASLSRGAGYDAIDITGSLNLNGTLEVIFLGEFEPQAGNSFLLFQVSEAINGAFNSLVLPELSGPGLSWDTHSLYTTGILGVIPEPRTYTLLFCLAISAFVLGKKRGRRS